jgi:SagB-type dehydrogenase family enzyme
MSQDGRRTPTTFAQLRSFAYGYGAENPAPLGNVDPAEEFHEASKISSRQSARMFGPAAAFFLSDPEAAFKLGRKTLAHAGDAHELARPEPLPVDLTRLIESRRSELPSKSGPISARQLATMLGLSAASSPIRPELRMYPSAGALYPLDVHVIVSDVDGVPDGRYLYDPIDHALVRRADLSIAEFHQLAALHTPTPTCAATFAIAATFGRTRAKYGLRGYRFGLLEAGHLAHGMLLAATALGLASLPWGGFADREVDEALDLDGVERSCLYLLSVAGPAESEVGTNE